ncbi:hypothetical protein Rsub_04520 [Raphidocelis subcapitata]|uniref:Kinesin-like protein n=1 Tax=Raphidocelis subcapitata TaxID=307507 RepID=A0A2V0NXR8_9CHLO|nr:hypothetical protein Rsub_04520 [Raphidocelis subcapitata]|eukprot:GBF92416.1 hypothetical protein Rsub_04520 [Raphidocelis subcapitata]
MALEPQLQQLEGLIMHPGRSSGGMDDEQQQQHAAALAAHHHHHQSGAGEGDGEDWPVSPSDDNFKVVVRVRPPLPRELRGFRPYECTVMVEPSNQGLITISENLQAAMSGATVADGMLYATYRFTFDHVYDQDSSQEDVYNQSARQLVHSTLQGYNAAIIAYGQTGTGKTYTMEGDLEGPLRGIIPRSIEDIFGQIQNDPEPSSRYLVRLSYLQIYNEVISDLLKPERTNLVIREDRRRGVFVDGLSEWVVRSPREVYELMMRGAEQRATGATKMNEVSSRSHAVCIIIVEKCSGGAGSEAASQDALMGRPPAWATGKGGAAAPPTEQSIRVGKLNLVDLAGSERVHITGATGKRLEESKKINASLSALGNVIAALTDRKDRQHIPYRDSKLTRILEDSLGGNCKTTMMCMVSPALEAFAESLSTLKFANRAKNIKNQAVVNEDLDQRTLLRKYERELRKLRAELQRRSKELVDKRRLLEVEEQKRQAEHEKLEVLKVLEARSREFMREKEEKRQLEAKIASMQGQLLIGGTKPEDSPTFRTLLAKEHRRIRGEYESRLRELEAERQMFEEDLAQVDRYKQLLLKQRDIMIALTARLNERDEQIMTLQEELEAYDKHQRLLEDQLDGKTAELIALRRAALEAEAARTRSGVLAEAGSSGGGTDEPSLRHQLRALQLENAELQAEAQQHARRASGASIGSLAAAAAAQQQQAAAAAAQGAAAAANGEVSTLRSQVAFASKEKAALQAILEGKALPLAQQLSRGLTETLAELGSGGGAGEEDSIGAHRPEGEGAERLRRQVTALQRLLAATVAAMARAGPAGGAAAAAAAAAGHAQLAGGH